MSEEYSDQYYKGPAYALVIGIGDYKNGVDAKPGEIIEKHQFTKLKYRAKDAEAFKKFLMDNGMMKDNIKCLCDGEADEKEIKRSLRELRLKCKASEEEEKNPLVIIYFSGHGEVDLATEENYLIPYDGERDDLAGSAIRHEEFKRYLDDIDTNKMVVFIDACHSGQIAGNGMGGPSSEYKAGEGLGEGEGRNIITSCRPGQLSYEWDEKESSIFTSHLIELLKGETGDFNDKIINTYDLYTALKKRVVNTALDLKKDKQEPFSDMGPGTGINIALNKHKIREIGEIEKRIAKERTDFLDAICRELSGANNKNIYPLAPYIKPMLTAFVNNKDRERGYDELYSCFDVSLTLVNRSIEERCRNIHRCFDIIVNNPKAVSKTSTAEATRSGDGIETVSDNKISDADISRNPPPTTIVAGEKEKLRLFSKEDKNYILYEIMTKMDYYAQAYKLSNCLGRTVSEEEFTMMIHDIEPEKEEDPLHGVLENIRRRFKEKWPDAKIVEKQTMSNFVMGKKKK